MKTNLLIAVAVLLLFSCTKNSKQGSIYVKDFGELTKAISKATPGAEIVLANGVWKDVEVEFAVNGTQEKPIVLRAETPGKVFIEGISFLKFGGDYLQVSGLHFRNGYTPSNAVIEFGLKGQVANHCKVTNCVIENFNQPKRDTEDHWVEFWGRHNELSNCNIIGKSNSGPTIRIQLKGNESISNYHRIVNNHFGPRPRKGGPHGETIQIGDSETSMSPSNTFVANNLFDRCNGEVEVISNKSNFNEYRNNVFFKCEGSLVLRHGNYCIVDGNFFIGDDNSENMGGIRVVNTGHWIYNNYFFNLKGSNFRSALAVMNGIPKSPLNRYNQVTDVVVAYNTWVNCKSPWQFSVGTNVSQKEVLPATEIRSARPIRTVVANNIIYNQKGDENPVVAYDKVDGVDFRNNYINNQNVDFKKYSGLDASSVELRKMTEYIYVPSTDLSDLKPYKGFDFETITNDLFGNSRAENNWVGAMCKIPNEKVNILDESKYGASWYSLKKPVEEGKILVASTVTGDIASKIMEAQNGDIIELKPGTYVLSKSLIIDKKITIQSRDKGNKAQIIYSGESATPAFELHPEGNLMLKNVTLEGQSEQYAFANLKENMFSLYNLSVEGCDISNFDFVLKAYKETFADSIVFSNSTIKNCANGIGLSDETDDNGNYNVEFLVINNCTFDNVNQNVVNYYRGGYDESTIGGNLILKNSRFTNCGAMQQNGILINSTGIVNVDISKNTFQNNSVKVVAILWGAKNNTQSENKIFNSGKFEVVTKTTNFLYQMEAKCRFQNGGRFRQPFRGI